MLYVSSLNPNPQRAVGLRLQGVGVYCTITIVRNPLKLYRQLLRPLYCSTRFVTLIGPFFIGTL